MSDAVSERKTPRTSQTADRVLEVLFVLLRQRHPSSLREVASASGFSPSTTHRLLASLVDFNLARQDPDTAKYSLGLGLLEFGHAILNHLDVRELSARTLSELNKITSETIHLAVLDGFDLVYIDRRDSPHGVRVNTSIGRRGTPHTTGVGKALLAFLPPALIEAYINQGPLEPKTEFSITDSNTLREDLKATRERGYSVDNQEDKHNVICIAAPILGAGGSPLASISISAPDSRHTIHDLTAIAPLLLEHTTQLSRSMGFRPTEEGGLLGSPIRKTKKGTVNKELSTKMHLVKEGVNESR